MENIKDMNTDMGPFESNVGEMEQIPVTKPDIQIKLIRDNLEAELLLSRTSSNTADPEEADIRAALAAAGVAYGVNDDFIAEMCGSPLYNKPMVIARGVAPETGADGHLNMLIETARVIRPKIREDGTADYKDLGLIQNVHAGDVLCEVIPPEKGADGRDVRDVVLEGHYGREAAAPIGQNVALTEEKDKVVAVKDGHVEYRKGVINVLDMMRIGGNVDNSTGDIDFVGDVYVSGMVLSGFKVKSKGSIVVKGTVEGAHLEAAGDISIGEGVNGMNRGKLIAGGNVKCRYIQNCYIKTDQDIYADTIMYCNVECGGNIELSGKRAILIGGRAALAGKLGAKGIGTESHVTTEIIMASTGLMQTKELEDLSRQGKQLDAEITKLVQIMTRFDELKKINRISEEQLQALTQVKGSYATMMQRRKEVAARIEQVKREQLEASRENSYIECKGRIHTGVRITFGPLNMTVRESFVNSRVHIVDGEIKISSL